MSSEPLRIALNFSPDDKAWLRRGQIAVPDFFAGNPAAPMQGDVLRIAGRQFVVQARVWEHEAGAPVLRLFLSDAHAQSDTVFG